MMQAEATAKRSRERAWWPLLFCSFASLVTIAPATPAADARPADLPSRRTAAQEVEPGDPEIVDFAEAPAKGLVFELEESGTYRVTGSIKAESDPAERIEQKIEAKLDFRQHVLDVDARGVRELERDYRRYELRIATKRMPGGEEAFSAPAEALVTKHPLHGVKVRARWVGEARSLRLEVPGDAGWGPAGEALRARLSTVKLLHPVLPMPNTAKPVGASWSLTPQQLQEYFDDTFNPGPKPKITGDSKLELTGFRTHADRRCAVIRVRFTVRATMERYPPCTFEVDGACLYDLGHRIVVAMTARGTMKTVGTVEKAGGIVELDLGGQFDSSARVKVTAAGRCCGGPVAVPR